MGDRTSVVGRRWAPVWVGLVALATAATGCAAQAEALPFVDLSDRQPLSEPVRAEPAPLRVAFAAVVSPRGTVDEYVPLIEYLESRLHRPVELVQRRTYAEANSLVRDGRVDMAFVCTSAYVAGRRDFGMRLLAAARVGGELVYRSLLIVPADSTALSMADLRGRTFAFTDPWSTTGRLWPTARVMALGSTPETFFERVFFTYSHDDAIRAVAAGVADGAAVDSLVYDFAVKRSPDLAARVRVIERSEPFAVPPVVTAPSVDPRLRAELRALLVGMDADPVGLQVLASIGIDRFEPIADAAYDSVRALEALVNKRIDQ